MKRRNFLKLSAMLALVSPTAVLTRNHELLTPRYVMPDSLTDPYGKLLLTNANIINVRNGEITKGQIMIQRGRIMNIFREDRNSEILPASDSDILPFDINGAYVAPGLINAHCHLSMPCALPSLDAGFFLSVDRQIERNAEECVKHGVTTVRDMAAVRDDLYRLKKKIDRGTVVGPRIVSSCVLDVRKGYMSLTSGTSGKRYFNEVNTPEEGVTGVRIAVNEGADLIKIAHQEEALISGVRDPEQMSQEITNAICKEAARCGLTVAMHHTDTAGLEKGFESGVFSFEHIASDRNLFDNEIEQVVRRGFYFVPTISVGYACSYEITGDPGWNQGFQAMIVDERAARMSEMMDEYCEPAIAAINRATVGRYSDPDYFHRFHLAPAINAPAFSGFLTYGVANMQELYKAGAQFGCGNDGGIPFNLPGAMGLEMYLLGQTGMEPEHILKMATWNNAELLGMSSEIGSIEVGKIADLAIFSDNPLENLETALNPVMVFQGGRLAFEAMA